MNKDKDGNIVINKEGLTLVALVVTIIIIIILAAIIVSNSINENGLFNRAKTAKEDFQNAEIGEKQIIEDAIEKNIGSYRQNIDELKTAVLDIVYPVGSIYIGTTDINPSTFIGGTWESFGEGRTLVGAGTGEDSNSEEVEFVAGDTGGEYNHTLSVNEMPSHSHRVVGGNNSATRLFSAKASLGSSASQAWAAWFGGGYNGVDNVYAGAVGGNLAHNNIQPYIVTYMWKRVS